MELWWGKLSFEGMPAFRDPNDGMIWVWDSESKTYTKKQEVDQPDRGHQTGGDNKLFDPFQHTEISGVPELEGHMAAWDATPDAPSKEPQFLDYEIQQAPPGEEYLECPNCALAITYGDSMALESVNQPWDVCPRCGEQMYDAHEAQAEEDYYRELDNDQAPGDYEMYGPDQLTYNDLFPYESKTAQEFVPEGQVKCPNCEETTEMPQCPECGKDLTPEWNKEQQKIDFLSQPHNVNSEFTSWPDREPKRNRMKTDDSFPSMISKTAVRVRVEWDMGSTGEEWDPYNMPPPAVDVPQDVYDQGYIEPGYEVIADWLSDQYGWAVNDWTPIDDDLSDNQPGDLTLPDHWAAWDDEQEAPQEEMLPVGWNPPAPGTSFEEIEAMLEQYGKEKEESECLGCEGTGDGPWGKCRGCDGTGLTKKPGRKPGQNRRKVGNNSWLERRDDGSIALRLHNTDVVRWYPDRIVMDTGGWHSRTTRDRMNWWIPGDVWTNRGNQFYLPPNRDPYSNRWDKEYRKNNLVDWYDNMATDYEGNVLPQDPNQSYPTNKHYVSALGLAQKIASKKLSQEEWEQWFAESGPARTEVGKWIQDSSGQLHWDQGIDTVHEDIARRNNIAWPSGLGAIGSVYSDNTADVQKVFPGAAVNVEGIQAQLQTVFGPIQLTGPISASGNEQKGTSFEPVVIQSGQYVLHSATLPITGQAWVKERSNGIPFNPEYVLVAEHLLTDDYELYANGVKAIITATGGLASHAAQLAASRGTPVVVGIGGDYNKIETGNYLKIDPSRQDITVLPYLTVDKSPQDARKLQDSLKQYDRQRNPQYYEDTLPTFSHVDEELAWKQANAPSLDSCPDCDAPMAERDGTKFCPDCGHKQPIIMTQASEKTAFLPALIPGAAALLGRMGLSAGAAAAGSGAARSGIGTLMRGAMSPKNLLMGQGVKSLIAPNGQPEAPVQPGQPGQPAPGVQQYGAPGQVPYVGITISNPDETETYTIKPVVTPVPTPAPKQPEKEEEKEREKEREKKVPASVKKADTFGEEEVGRGTKNRGEDSDPEHDGSGANFEEKGDSPELLKDVDGEGSADRDPDAVDPEQEQQGGDPDKALELFDSNLPLILEFATSDQDGSGHPILVAIDEILEQAFPGYKDLVEDVEELTGEDYDQDNEEGEPDDHQEAVEEAGEDEVDEKTASVWHYGWETAPMATPAPTLPVPGQTGTCQLCGQSHMPGTPCPTSGSPVMQQPTAVGAPITPPQPNKVVTHADDYGDWEDENHFEAAHTEIDDNTRRVEADASHMRHQHEDEGRFEDSVKDLDSDINSDATDPDAPEWSGNDGLGGEWKDENGDPLQEGQDYELKSSEYAIPDRVTIEQIDGDEIVFTIHSGDVDYRDSLSQDDMDTFGYTFLPADSDGIDSVSDFALEDEDPIRPGHDSLPQVDDLTEPSTVVSSLENYVGSFHGDNPNNRDWLMGGGGVDVDPDLMAKLAGKDYSPREQREFIDEQGTARNLSKLDLDGTHYVMDDELGTGDSLW